MKEINIARSVAEKRREKGLTQENLAAHIGVSKATVSKWESGQSYPDITLLPQLAAFFNISIDELMGYEPQMTKEDIRKLYRRIAADFSTQPFAEVLAHCREISRKYYSCFPLLFQIGALLVNHSMLAKEKAASEQIIAEAKALFARIKTESEDIELAKQALHMEALCLLSLGRAEEVLCLLESTGISLTSPEPLLAAAYQMTGKTKDAACILQVGIYQDILGLFDLLAAYLKICRGDKAAYEETYRRALAVADAFQLESLHPARMMSFYISAAQDYIESGDPEQTIILLEQYTDLAAGEIYPLRLHGDHYFHLLDEWFESALALGRDLPRGEKTIRTSMTEAVTGNPAFAVLADDPRFKNIVSRLKKNEEG